MVPLENDVRRHDEELERVRLRLSKVESALDFLHGEIAGVKGQASRSPSPRGGKIDRTGETYDVYCARIRAARHKPMGFDAWLVLQERRPVR